MKPANSYDLVICREVMEHLTVFQIKRTVENIVRTTSRFVYCTTRFHPSPASLVDFTTQFDVDPTHITLLNKDFLRLLFVLEGCRSRPDLEARDGLVEQRPGAGHGEACPEPLRFRPGTAQA